MSKFWVVVFVSLAFVPSARADRYLGLGIGSDSGLDGRIAQQFTAEDSGAGRLVLGQRMALIALEASIFGTDLRPVSGGLLADGDYSTVSVGLDLKFFVPLFVGFEGFVRGGMNHTWLVTPSSEPSNHRGYGIAYGVGLQYTLPLRVTDLIFWLDFSRQQTKLREGDRVVLDGGIKTLVVGLSVAL